MYTMDARVRYSELDATGRLSTMGLINFLQDTSIFHCEDVGRSVASLAEEGFAWYILTWDITINHLPKLGERIHVRTWVPGMRGLLCSREFVMESDEGDELVRATSSWVFFDVNQGRAIRIPEAEAAYFSADFDEVPPHRSRRSFRPTSDPVGLSPITVGVQHIDTNMHVNNAQYIRIARESVFEAAREGLVEQGVATATRELPLHLEVEYRNMARLGDVLTPHVFVEDGSVLVSLDGDEKPSALVRFSRA